MFVFLVLPTLYTNDTLTGFAKATKTCRAAKWYWRPLPSSLHLPRVHIHSRGICPLRLFGCDFYTKWSVAASSVQLSQQRF